MESLVVYDSVFGNTEKVAVEIAKALGSKAVRVQKITSDGLKDIELLVVGSPTRAFSAMPSIKEWIKSLEKRGLPKIHAAAFDTRSTPESIPKGPLRLMVRMFGYADKKIAAALKRKGFITDGNCGFFVEGSEGPLKEGELKRAADWAKNLHKQGSGK